MKTTNEKLAVLKENATKGKTRIMIIGLGSVGNYVLDYLMSTADENLEIIVCGRNKEKLTSDVNIVRVASMIRRQNKTEIKICRTVDLNIVSSIADAITTYQPDIILNSSRAYSGLKYGSISWANIRAYGIWTPLSIKFTKNIMEAYAQSGSDAVVINTSYSDAVIPWLKTAGKAYPDFGSGNVNHLLPRIKFATAKQLGISDYWNVDVTFAVAHFHDVVISKEGQTEGLDMLIDIRYNGAPANVDLTQVFTDCAISMPVDAKRNMMNASSNFEIMQAVLGACRNGETTKLHCPGVFGEIGGYPVIVDGSKASPEAYIDESIFTLDAMREKNRASIYLDGIENVADGVLTYTDELIAKVKDRFGANLMKSVAFDEIDDAADFLIHEIIEKNIGGRS